MYTHIYEKPRVGPFLPAGFRRACVSLCLPIHYGYNNKERPLRQLLSMPPTPLSSVGTCNSPLRAHPPLPLALSPSRVHMYIILCAMLTLFLLSNRPHRVSSFRVERVLAVRKMLSAYGEYGHLRESLTCKKRLTYSRFVPFSSRKNINCKHDSCNTKFNHNVLCSFSRF